MFGSRNSLFDIYFANPFLRPNDLNLVPEFIGQADGFRDSFEQNNWRRKIGSADLNVFDPEHAIDEWLSHFDVFDSIKFERLGHFAENAFSDFQAFAG